MSEGIPEGWEIKRLKDVGRCVRGLTYSPDDVAENGLLVLRSSNIQNGRLTFTDNVYVDLEIDDEYLSKKDDIVICVRNGSKRLIGKSAIVKVDNMRATHGAFMTVFRSDANNFVQHLIKSEQFFTFVSRDIGATINSINNSNLLQYKFEFPSTPEQQKIASILTSVDEVIEKTEVQISKLQDLKKGMMQELLTKGIGHTEFKDSPVGRVPVSWDVQPIKSICTDVVDCVNKTAPAVDYPTPFRMIRTTNVRNGKVDTENVKFVTEETYKIWIRRLIPKDGDLIFTREAPVGESGILRNAQGVFLGQRTMMYRADPRKSNIIYLMYSLHGEYCKKQLEDFSGGSTVAHMRVPDCEKILIKVPHIEEQNKIASAISSVDNKIDNLQIKKNKLLNQKKALMQDLLTGKVRVKVN